MRSRGAVGSRSAAPRGRGHRAALAAVRPPAPHELRARPRPRAPRCRRVGAAVRHDHARARETRAAAPRPCRAIRSASSRAATITTALGRLGVRFGRTRRVILPRILPRRPRPANWRSTWPTIEAHITGTVWKIEVAPGDNVDEGDTVVILESMKMEMPVEAEDAGTVKEISVEEGQAVSEGDTLVVLE